MMASTPRTALRTTRALRVTRPTARRTNARFQSSTATPAAQPQGGSSSHIIAGVAGGSLVFLSGYAWYHFSGVKTFVNTAHQTKSYFDKAFKKSTEAAPAPNEAIQWLRETVTSYTKMIPGASGYVDSAFDDLDKVREKHGKEVDSIVKETYDELKEVTKAGVSFAAAAQAWDVLQKCLKKIGSLAGDAAEDILENHPELKDKVGGSVTQLKNMGEQYGPEAKKQVDETWSQVQDILKGGFGVGSISKIQKLIQDKTEDIKKFGDQAWQKGIEQAQPILEKQPQLKKIVDENKDKLLQGDLSQLWQKLQEAVKSGNTDDVTKFVKEQTDKAQGSMGGGIDQLVKMIPGGKEIMPKLQQLQELSEKHGKETENLVKSAIDDIKQVLSKKVEEGQKIKEKAEADAKK